MFALSIRHLAHLPRSAVVPTVPFSEPPLVAAAAAAAASPTLYRFSSFVGCSWDAGVVALSWSRWRATAMPTGMEATDEAVVLVVVPGGWVVECCCVLLVVPDASPSCSIVAATALELALAPPPVPSVALPEVQVLPPTVTLLMIALALWLRWWWWARATGAGLLLALLPLLLLLLLPPAAVSAFGEDASSFMMAFRAVALLDASKLFDVVTSDT